MNYNRIIPLILKNQIIINPKGYYSRLRLTHKRVLNWIITNTKNIDNTATIGERVYWIINSLQNYPLCQECKCKRAKFYSVIHGYGKFCSMTCTNKNENHRQQAVKTSITKFGKGNGNNRQQAISTMKQKYGVDYFTQTQKFIDGKNQFLYDNNAINTFQIDFVKQKACNTKLKCYNDSKYTNINKQKETIAAFSNEKKLDIRNKHIQTNRLKYGVDWNITSSYVKEKIKQSNLHKYGVEYPIQSALFRRQILGKRYIYNNISFDSSDELKMYIWLKDNNIIFEYQPNISFEYMHNGKTHRYMPDFKVGNKYIELKGDQFFKSDGTMQNPFNHTQDALYEAKHQCMINNNVIIIKISSICCKIISDYICIKYGKNYIKQFKINKIK